ncbi:MAG: IclR family transcriptional regulator [Rhodobacteraceae bacterium]|nr:IclR family transcriptional regulator [Paracoccaceae bacterium]
MSDDNDRYRAPALDKGLDILELLSGIDGGMTQAEIAKALGRSPNEFYRMLDRLARRGYVARVDGDRYALTLKLFGLAHLHTPVRRLASLATPLLRELAKRTWQANQLVVLDRGNPVVVAQQEAPGYWGISIRVGSHIGLFDTGSGHVLLAFATPQRRREIVAENQDTGAPAREIPPELEARFEKIRADAYEAMPSAQTVGVTNLSAPVLAPNGEVVAAVTIPSLPLKTADAPAMEDAVLALLDTTRTLSALVGRTDGQGETFASE